MPKTFQTIIVGAGPAGLIAGKYLKDALILEQKKEIGRPIQCAEAISQTALEEQGIKPSPDWISAVIDEVEVIAPSGKKIKIKVDKLGFILDRPVFEKFLAKKCQAKIQLNQKVVDIKKEENGWKLKTQRGLVFESQYLIGADGPLSIVRRKIFNEKVGLLPCIEYLVKLEKEIKNEVMRMYFDKEKFPDGYAWIFPKSSNTANIGLGGKRDLDKTFQYLMETRVRPEFGPYQLLENKSGVVPWGGAKIKLFQDNAFLVGDAGALADPIFGGGINNAMISGRIAAESILSGKPHLYERKIKKLPSFSAELLSAQKILYSMPNPVLNQLAEILEKKDVFYLKTIPGILEILSKEHLRKNFSKIVKFFLILEKNTGSFA